MIVNKTNMDKAFPEDDKTAKYPEVYKFPRILIKIYIKNSKIFQQGLK